MGVEFLLVRDISDGDLVKLRRVPTSSRIDRDKDRPCEHTAYNADENEGLEKAEIEVGVD
jgi:hypothetical protein